MTEYTVHFQKGTRVGARSLRMITVEADNPDAAVFAAKSIARAENLLGVSGYRMTRVDHFEGLRRVRDR